MIANFVFMGAEGARYWISATVSILVRANFDRGRYYWRVCSC